MRIMVEVPTLLALLDGKATEKEVQAICQQVKTLGEDAENLEKRLKKCIK
jgi:ubiquinone biosynthesis protein UbiJ